MNTFATNRANDPYLDLALEGVHLIEASAGTGKTFTLTTLVIRLVVERDLRLGQVLTVTFTEAATQELRARLRKRLALAAEIAVDIAGKNLAAPMGGPEATDGDPADDAEAALTRHIIQRQLQHEDGAVLAARLRRAESEIDLAAVFTIHGFCARVLGEHALQTGRAFDPPQMVASERELREELAADLWRTHGAGAHDAELLHMLWKTPAELARDLHALLRSARLLPPPPDDSVDPLPALQQAADVLRAKFRAHGDDLRSALDAAIAGKLLNGNSYRGDLTDALWPALQAWCATGEAATEIHSHLDRLLPTTLAAKTNKNKTQNVLESPVCDAVAALLEAQAARRQWVAGRSIDLLHRIRADALQRLDSLKQVRRVQTYDDLIDGVADALDGSHADDLASALRKQYAVALVDEFQDTDVRQWGIFRRVFGSGANPALFMIGDPKQAIYGFRGGDIHTYLAAKRDATPAPPLSHNFRSRPGVLRTIQALYAQAGDDAFVDERIRFHPVEPGAGNADADYQRNGESAAALTIRVLPAAEKPCSADHSRELAVATCVAEIHGVLADARAGRAMIKDQPVQPGDIAVLVRNHLEATRMQSALVAAGIAAVAAGKQSLFATEQAGELLALFDALLQPADDGRLRAALATVLLGVDAAGIARLDTDADWHQQQQMRALAWRERWQRHGPLALVSDICAVNAERLLGLVDGERRLTNLMQLGELLQQADARSLGLHGLVDWLRTRIVHADPDDEQQLLRLESDARRVQILTLHKSKGLEFGLVFLPFAGIGRKDDAPSRNCEVATDEGRVLHWKVGKDDDSQRWKDAVAGSKRDQRAEAARLLYVGLTRARHALWLASGPFFKGDATAQAAMLSNLEALREKSDIAIDARDLPVAPLPLSPPPASAVPPARRATRVLDRDWWVYSFTQLAHAEGGADASAAASADERGASDEPLLPDADVAGDDGTAEATAADFDRRFSGSRFGNVLHDALEHVDFGAWSGWRGGAAPAGQDAALRNALRAEGYAGTDLDDGVAELAPLVGRTLTVALPEGGRLCELPAASRRAELEFHFAMQSTPVEVLLSTLQAHGVLRGRNAFGARRRLEGLMTGKIDLTYGAGGRWYLLDYKSNRLPAYDRASLDAAMTHSEYDLQALIYTVALHRWLRFRLGDRYDYARDFGGVRYLFCRGLDADADRSQGDGPGVHAHVPPWALVQAVDALFGGGA